MSKQIYALLFLAILYHKHLPGYYHFYIGKKILKHRLLVLLGLRKNPKAIKGGLDQLSSTTHLRVHLSDIDMNFHMNNASYNLHLDYARADFLGKLFAGTFFNGPFRIANGGVCCVFLKEIKPFATYRIETRVLSFDRKWLILEHRFLSGKDVLHAIGQSKIVFKAKSGKKGQGPTGKTVAVSEALVRMGWFESEEEATNAEWVKENMSRVQFQL